MAEDTPGTDIEAVGIIMDLTNPEKGEYRITPEDISYFKMDFFKWLADRLQELVDANPHYEFNVDDDPFSGDIVISWRKRHVDSPDEESAEQDVRPELGT